MTVSNEERACAAGRTPFDAALAEALSRRGIDLESFCPPRDAVARRVLEEYGAMFVAADDAVLPPVCVFTSEEEVQAFQRRAGWRAARFGDYIIELQPAALEALLAAREEARRAGGDLTPRDGAEAGRRGYDDSLRLWRSRCEPALDYWCECGRLSMALAERMRELPLREQIAAVLALEDTGVYFSKDFSKSILRSVAAPGASQHLAMLAFDATEFRDPRARRALARHGWFQTVLSDLPHFTYLGLDEQDLPVRGLRMVEEYGQRFWIPDLQVKEGC